MNAKQTALDAYLARTAAIHAKLERLQQLADDHFGHYVITKGRGNYWNINANKAKYKQRGQLGIGVINASETNLVDNLKHRVVGYLCKSTQFVSLRPPEGLYSKRKIKTIRRGEFPVKPPKKLGRPRKTQVLP